MRGLAAVLGGLLLAQGAGAEGWPEGDPAAGREAAGQCRICHGLDGLARMPMAPHIAGEPAAYLAAQLGAFRSGEREHEIMSIIARGLDDQTIADLAAWYAVPEIVLEVRDAAAAPEACTACHGANGRAQVEDAPNLAGENVPYLVTQLKAFRSGKRRHEVMSDIAAEMGDDEIRVAAEYYAGISISIAE